MNLILCAVVASILVNAIKSDKSVEEEIKEMKSILEQFKVKAESMKQKVEGHSELQNEFDTAVADTDKIIQILNNSLKIFGQQRKNKEKGKLKAEKNTLKKKLTAVITTLGTLESEVSSVFESIFYYNIDFAIGVANNLSKVLDSLKEEENAKKINTVRHFASDLSNIIHGMVKETKHAKNIKKARESVDEFNKTLKDLLV